MTTPKEIEADIQFMGLTAARVTPAALEGAVRSEHYFTAGEALRGGEDRPVPDELYRLTFCVLILDNGFTVTGESACASPENFNPMLGRKIARQHAIDKVWPLLGFRLRDQLSGRAGDLGVHA